MKAKTENGPLDQMLEAIRHCESRVETINSRLKEQTDRLLGSRPAQKLTNDESKVEQKPNVILRARDNLSAIQVLLDQTSLLVQRLEEEL